MKQTFYFSKVRDVKAPERGTPQSAGIDFFVPAFNELFLKDLIDKNPSCYTLSPGNYSYIINDKLILLAPGQRILIPSGIKMRGHENIALIAHNKSGVASKKGLDHLAEVVDADYQGEIHINVVNTSSCIVEIKENEKLIQFLEVKVETSDLKEVDECDLFTEKTIRGEGGFGHTNK